MKKGNMKNNGKIMSYKYKNNKLNVHFWELLAK